MTPIGWAFFAVEWLRVFFPLALLLAGALLVWLGGASALQPAEHEPSVVGVGELTRGGLPEARYLTVPDGVLFWPEAVVVRERLPVGDAAEPAVRRWFVPLLTADAARAWLELAGKDERPDAPRYLWVRFDAEVARATFARLERGESHPTLEPFIATGRFGAAFFTRGLGRRLRELGIERTDAFVLHHGEPPPGRAFALGVLAVGLACGWTGIAWIRWRRRRGARTTARAA